MAGTNEQLLRDAVRLPAAERAVFADELLSSLERPSGANDALWVREANDRIAPYEAGELDALPAE